MSANSLVGVSSSACNIGKQNAPVFPEPVSAKPIISLPIHCNVTVCINGTPIIP